MSRFFMSLGVALAAWLVGFFVFLARLPSAPTSAPGAADAIVIFTGGGARIAAGMELLSDGVAPRLFISGVHPETTRESLIALSPESAALFDCCVELGHQARSTEGNAEEVARWVEANGVSTLVLVTSDYHIPRALVETKARLPRTELRPFAVESGLLSSGRRPAYPSSWAQLAYEYTKFLAAHLRTFAVKA